MCEFCECLKKLDDGFYMSELLPSNKYDACIIPPSPISQRKRPDQAATIMICGDLEEIDLYIKYCPMCGREIK